MKWALYNVLFAIVYPFLLPGFLGRMLRRGGYAARMGDRFALYPAGLFGRNRPLYDSHAPKSNSRTREQSTNAFVWIHAVSVGEVQVAGQLMREWRKVEPGVRFCFSTTSSTGWKMALKEVKGNGEEDGDVLIYNPLDFPNFVKSALRTVRPRAIVLTESEIWPNFIRMAKHEEIPLFLINARVSDRSAPRYKLAKWWFGDVLSSFTRIFAQSDLDKERLVAAGAPEAKVEVTGSFKFDVAHRNLEKEQELRNWILGSNRVGVGSDRVGLESNRVGVGSNRVGLGSDRVGVGSNRVGLGSDRVGVGSDRVGVGSDRVGVGSDRVGVGSNRVGLGSDRVGVESDRRDRGDAKLTLGDAKPTLGDAKPTLGDAKPTLSDPKILLGGSIWPGEDEVLLKIYKKILDSSVQPSAFGLQSILVLAPRHFEKADAVETNIRKHGFTCVRRGRGEGRTTDDARHKTENAGQTPVFLADTTGELMGLYGIADVVFVGKSLCAHGSQNMIEPCLCGKPTFVGPYTENFRPVMSDLLASDAIVQVKDAAELEEKIVKSLECSEDLEGLGARASEAVRRRLGVVSRCVTEMRGLL